jgi:serine/threonine-protein kinase
MAYSPATGQLYSTSLPNPGVNNKIIVINTKANPITTTTLYVGSSASSNPSTVALNPVNGKIYTANFKDQSVSVIDPSHNNSVTTIQIQTPYPQFIAVDSGTGEVYVTALGPLVCNPSCDGGLTAIDPTTNLITTTVQVGNTPSSVAVDPSSHNVYVANFVDGTVDVISPSQGYALTHTISTGPYTGPTALVLDSSGKVYAASQNTHSTPNNPLPGYVDVINPALAYSVTAITVGIDPLFITFDSGADLIAVSNYSSNTISYISPTSLSVTATIAVGSEPNAIISNGTFKGAAVANSDGTVSLITD